MSMKKKLGSKLASGVHQVKTLREQNPASEPAKNAPVVKKSVPQATPASAMAKPVAPRTKQSQSVTSLDGLHPRRVWPD